LADELADELVGGVWKKESIRLCDFAVVFAEPVSKVALVVVLKQSLL
jgi:hypothetical protein